MSPALVFLLQSLAGVYSAGWGPPSTTALPANPREHRILHTRCRAGPRPVATLAILPLLAELVSLSVGQDHFLFWFIYFLFCPQQL